MDWESLKPIEQFDVMVVHAMAVGQTAFLALWARLPWWGEWVGRALMVKSITLWVLIVGSLALFWAMILTDEPWAYMLHARLAMNVLVTVGIWIQFWALAREVILAKRPPVRPVSGTSEPPAEESPAV